MERPGATERRRRHVRPAVFSLILFILLAVSLLVVPASGQDMMRGLDLTSPRMTEAAMTRAEVKALLARATKAEPADLSRAELNGLGRLPATRLPGLAKPSERDAALATPPRVGEGGRAALAEAGFDEAEIAALSASGAAAFA